MTQKERQERRKEEIYHAALIEFGTLGYEKVSMERICGQHGISKGIMYHYYSNKDELFLLCVGRTFADLRAYVERDAGKLAGQGILETIKNFFMIREYYFQLNPRQKMIFEDAMLHPPKHLVEQIQELRGPIREVNREFIRQLLKKAPLRSEVDFQKAVRYLESVEYYFQSIMRNYRDDRATEDMHTMFETAEEILEMVLFGILHQSEEENPASPCEGDRPNQTSMI